MEITRPMKFVKLGALVLSTMMLMAFLVPTPAADASAFSGSPCPRYSIQDVFDDPKGNWDGDSVNNSDELYNGLDPCTPDTRAFCSGGGNPLCWHRTYVHVSYPGACQTSITAFPSADYDGDGVSNNAEILNGANPCTHPCPNWTGTDLALNPNGSWDGDGMSNAIEVNQGTNPCKRHSYDPCPYYSLAQVRSMPGYDWDGDGVSNSAEVQRGTSPCYYNAVQHVYQTTQRLPHVSTNTHPVYVAPVPPTPVCPYGYPYYHTGRNLCYANPVGRPHVY